MVTFSEFCSSENIVGEGENVGHMKFSNFVFQTLVKTLGLFGSSFHHKLKKYLKQRCSQKQSRLRLAFTSLPDNKIIQISRLNPVPNKPWFSGLRSTSLLKTLCEKEKLLVTSNFSFSHSVFKPFREHSAISIKF